MKKLLLLAILILITNTSWSQSGQVNGFKDIKFNTSIKNYSNFQLKKLESDLLHYEQYLTCYKVLNLPSNLAVGDSKVLDIFIFCSIDQIIRIDVSLNSFSYEKLEQMFGKPNKEDHWRSDSSNGVERAAWDIPNSIIEYYSRWYTKNISEKERAFRSKFGGLEFNLPVYEYELRFKVRNYEDIIKKAKNNEAKETLNDFNTPIN